MWQCVWHSARWISMLAGRAEQPAGVRDKSRLICFWADCEKCSQQLDLLTNKAVTKICLGLLFTTNFSNQPSGAFSAWMLNLTREPQHVHNILQMFTYFQLLLHFTLHPLRRHKHSHFSESEVDLKYRVAAPLWDFYMKLHSHLSLFSPLWSALNIRFALCGTLPSTPRETEVGVEKEGGFIWILISQPGGERFLVFIRYGWLVCAPMRPK